MSQSQIEGLKKELARVRAKARILEACLEFNCRVWNADDLENHPYPTGLNHAVSYRAVGEGGKFLVLGGDLQSIESVAQIYAKERFRSSATNAIALDQSRIGFMFEEHGLVWEVIAPHLYEKECWSVASIGDSPRSRIIDDAGLATKKEFSLDIDAD
jgi:hypothetical protein